MSIEVQAVWHRADKFTRTEAADWCASNGFKNDVYATREADGDTTHHIHPQFDSSEAKEDSWRTISDTFPEGISATVCERKEILMHMMYTKGEQSADDPWEFVMSDQSVDRDGDILMADGWDLSAFRKNPIALFSHSHRDIVGKWSNVRVEGKRLLGKLTLAAEGTSELVNTVRSLVEQRILKAVSVGFIPKDFEPIKDRDGYTTGYRFTKQALHEGSLVAVPANPNALSLAKSLGASDALLKSIFCDEGTGQRAAPIDFEAKARETGIALAKLNRSLTRIESFQS